MPDVYTPSAASWNSTALVGKPGEKLSAPGYADTGMKALDNLAYLTGASTSSGVKRIAYVADLTDLKSITAGSRRDKDIVVVMDYEVLGAYSFRADSSEPSDSPYIVVPFAGSGRWHRIGSKPGINMDASGEKSTHTWVIPGSHFYATPGASNYTADYAAGKAGYYHPQSMGVLHTSFNALNIGDKYSSVTALVSIPAGGELYFEVYKKHVSGFSESVTLLGTSSVLTSVNTYGTVSFTEATWNSGDCLFFVVHIDNSGGSGGTAVYLKSLYVTGSRYFIKE